MWLMMAPTQQASVTRWVTVLPGSPRLWALTPQTAVMLVTTGAPCEPPWLRPCPHSSCSPASQKGGWGIYFHLSLLLLLPPPPLYLKCMSQVTRFLLHSPLISSISTRILGSQLLCFHVTQARLRPQL
ncbi:sodium/potassium-transporting ATPase subunit beta-1-interacting protein 3-like protein [Lates japonicus]|uniref:Sodium/potassium-transporting ATPase subunit beta-1-interacting protein 3-like protein n=1 Tax=Lates japonicus TaxID=270547 RepID=A0AAD3NLH7_LATJO|nr:sodium/potassium-transporting ATPase subunit beta-1-interacting protein 3-like protein [Lates japonicus]